MRRITAVAAVLLLGGCAAAPPAPKAAGPSPSASVAGAVAFTASDSAGRKSPSDKLGDTIDYAAVVSRIEASLAENQFNLLETLAEHIAQLVMREFKSPWVKVSVTKLAALKNVKRLGITIERGSKTG